MDRKLLDPSTLQTLCTHSKCVFVQIRKRGKQRGILGVSFRHLSRAWQAKTSPNSTAFYRLGTAELTHKDQYGPNRNLTVVKIIFLHGVSTINRHFERFHTGSAVGVLIPLPLSFHIAISHPVANSAHFLSYFFIEIPNPENTLPDPDPTV